MILVRFSKIRKDARNGNELSLNMLVELLVFSLWIDWTLLLNAGVACVVRVGPRTDKDTQLRFSALGLPGDFKSLPLL